MSSKKPLILVAEDDSLYARIYQVKLTKEGYDVVVVGNGRDAVKKAQEIMPDLILMDLIMPDMDGFAALRAIKTKPKTKDLRIMVMSNLGQESDMKRAKDMGAENYFIKANVSVAEMVEMIKNSVGEGGVVQKIEKVKNAESVAEEKPIEEKTGDSSGDGLKIIQI